MISLKGIAYSSGAIEFTRAENPWAFQRMDVGLKSGQEKRIVFKPEVAPIEIAVSSNIAEKDIPWIERTRKLLLTADTVYLQRLEDKLRFRQAVHEVELNQNLITLGSQAEVEEYAAQHWQRLTYLFAFRHGGFRFDISNMVCREKESEQATERVEISARQVADNTDALPKVTFDATGSTANMHIVGWRSSVKEEESGKFALDGGYITLSVGNVKQPLTFCHDYRATLKSHTYIFEGEKMDLRLKRVLKRRRG